MVLRYTVQAADNDRSVYSIMRRELKISAALTRRLKQADGIRVDGQPAFTNRRLASGENVEIDIASAEPPCDVVPEAGELDILYEDAGLIAVNKPTGLITHPSHARYTGTLANFVAGYLLKTTGDARCHAVNRLDRDTSGVVLFAKNSHMKARAGEALAMESAEKLYIALVDGAPDKSAGTIDLPIRRLAENELRRVVSADGQRAVTHYATLQTTTVKGQVISLLQLRLETGRTHQIRVHCLAAGYPVLGDILYYSDASRSVSESLDIRTQALHAQTLTLTEPLSGKRLQITAPIPNVFKTVFGGVKTDILNIDSI